MKLDMVFDDFGGMMKIAIEMFTPKVFYSFLVIAVAVLVALVLLLVKRNKRVLIGFSATIGVLIVFLFSNFGTMEVEQLYLQDEAYQSHISHQLPLRELVADTGFRIGVAVNDKTMHDEAIMTQVVRDFNAITPETGFKWTKVLVNNQLGVYDFSKSDEYVEFAEANEMSFRGHALIWGKGYPSSLRGAVDSAVDKEAAMKEIMAEYIQSMVGRYRGRIKVWDVVNEPIDLTSPGLEENIFYEVLGREYIAYAFEVAHEADPEAELFMNGYFGSDFEVLYELLKEMVDEGVPIHGFGLQGHTIYGRKDAKDIAEKLQRICDLGLKVEITEMDVRLRALDDGHGRNLYEEQGRYYGEIIAALLPLDNFSGVTFWGTSDNYNWYDGVPPFGWMKPNAPLLFDADMQKKPAYYKVYDEVYKVYYAGN